MSDPVGGGLVPQGDAGTVSAPATGAATAPEPVAAAVPAAPEVARSRAERTGTGARAGSGPAATPAAHS